MFNSRYLDNLTLVCYRRACWITDAYYNNIAERTVGSWLFSIPVLKLKCGYYNAVMSAWLSAAIRQHIAIFLRRVIRKNY